ncbi:MAG TPA: MFS transporter [Vicinamibacterales bacterium]|nr:MFS transporter [Vicinamibacterales bacterium]
MTAAAFIGFTGFTLVMPFLPLYIDELGVHDAGAIALWSGVSLGVTPAVTAMMAPIWARVAERYGKKLMVARSLGSFVVIMTATAFVTAPWQVFALRTLQGFFAGYGPIAMTMAAESAPPDKVVTAIGWVQTAQRLGPALGPVIGGVIAQAVGLRRSFFVAAVFYLAACLLVMFGYREPRPAAQAQEAPKPAPATWRTLRRVRYFTLFVGTVLGLQLVDRSFGPVLPLYLLELGMPAARVPFLSGLIFTAMAAAAAAGNQLTGRLLGRWRVAKLVPAGAAAAALAASIFALAAPVGALLAMAVVFGLGLGVATTAIYTAATRAVTAADRGMAFSYLTTAYLVGLALSPVIAGLIGALSMRAVFVADAIALAGVAWLVASRMRGGAARATGIVGGEGQSA